MTTPEQRAALLALADKATPRPWEVVTDCKHRIELTPVGVGPIWAFKPEDIDAVRYIAAACNLAPELAREVVELRNALARVVYIINSAGLSNLSNGVQLGQMSWHVKAKDALDYAESLLNGEEE